MKKALLLLAICLFVGCKSETSSVESPSINQEVSPCTTVLVDSDFTYSVQSVEWLTDEILLFGSLEPGAKSIQNAILTTLYLYDAKDGKTDRINLSEIEGFSYYGFFGGNQSCGHDDQALYLYGSRYQQGNKYEARFFVKIPYRDPSSYELTRHDQNIINRISVTQGMILIGNSDVITTEFIIRDGFTGEETHFNDKIAYQAESAEVSPDCTKLFMGDDSGLRIYLPEHLLPENNPAFWPYEQEKEKFWESTSMTGVFSLSGELLYRLALPEIYGLAMYWSANSEYLLRIDNNLVDYTLDLEVRFAKDGTLIREQHFDDALWLQHFLAGDFLYFLSEDKTHLTIVNLSSGQEKSMEFLTAVDDIALTPNGKTAAIVRGDVIQIIDIL